MTSERAPTDELRPGMPTWVKVLGIVAGILLVHLAIAGILVGGGHGPGRHRPPERASPSYTPADHR